MSYEGWVQTLCKNGHAASHDAYDSFDRVLYKCAVCGAGLAWENDVDVTNGSFDEDNKRIDGYVELEVDKPAEFCTCEKCGNKHIVKEATFKIPPPRQYPVDREDEEEPFPPFNEEESSSPSVQPDEEPFPPFKEET